jgi:hypothetical protein
VHGAVYSLSLGNLSTAPQALKLVFKEQVGNAHEMILVMEVRIGDTCIVATGLLFQQMSVLQGPTSVLSIGVRRLTAYKHIVKLKR